MPDMSPLVMDLITLINRMPPIKDRWKRLRIALTEEELNEYRKFIQADNPKIEGLTIPSFVWAIRGVPIHIEEFPEQPMYRVEPYDE